MRWFTYSDHTRVVLEIGKGLRYKTSRRGRYGYTVSIPYGTIDWSEKTDVEDGAVEYIHLYQERKRARITCKPQPRAGGRTVRGPGRALA